MITWTPIADVLPEGKSGNISIEHFVVSKEDSEATSLRAIFRPTEFVEPGKYARLLVNGGVMMSDTRMEKRSNLGVVLKAHGNVLIAGLGIGMIIHPIAAKPEVTSITVIEKSEDVVKLVGPSVPKNVNVIHGDIFTWTPPKGTKYDTIYFDIWPDITTDNLDDMAKLNRRFAKSKAPGAWVDSWQREILLDQRRRNKRHERNNPYRSMVRCGTFR